MHPFQLHTALIAARALATYVIPGCVGRGVRLGSESSSGGGVWKSGNLEIWEFGDLGTWKSGNLEIWGPGNPEIWSPTNQKKKSSKAKSVLPKMSARSGLVGKNPPGPIWGHLRPFFPWTGKMQKIAKKLAISLGGPLLLSTRGGVIGTFTGKWHMACPWYAKLHGARLLPVAICSTS